jgi:hypothetical protein
MCCPVAWDSLLMFRAGASASELEILPSFEKQSLESVLYQASTGPT